MKQQLPANCEIKNLMENAEKLDTESREDFSGDYAKENSDREQPIRFYSPWVHRSPSASHTWKRS